MFYQQRPHTLIPDITLDIDIKGGMKKRGPMHMKMRDNCTKSSFNKGDFVRVREEIGTHAK